MPSDPTQQQGPSSAVLSKIAKDNSGAAGASNDGTELEGIFARSSQSVEEIGDLLAGWFDKLQGALSGCINDLTELPAFKAMGLNSCDTAAGVKSAGISGNIDATGQFLGTKTGAIGFKGAGG